MPRTRRLLRDEEMTYSIAKEQESRFFAHIQERQEWMKAIAVHHLNLKSSTLCHVAGQEDWSHGGFNVCIPITVDGCNKRVLMRFPLPYRVGEAVQPGNSDEKIRCEAGSYAWLEENCADVPIPPLYGFGLSSGETFTRVENLSILSRCVQLLRRKILSFLGYPTPSSFVSHQTAHRVSDGMFNAGYLLVEFIEEAQGTMLSDTWVHGQHDIKSHKFLPRYISEYTYPTADSYILDILAYHDSRFRNQPNAINDLGDCEYQLSALSAMGTIFPCFFQRDYRRGPSCLVLTDLHQSNIFVDAEWNITCLVDLEWACSRPIEMINPPYWLTNKGVDQLDSAEYDAIRTGFMEILTAEELALAPATSSMVGNSGILPQLSDVMNQTWSTRGFWHTLALSSPSGMFSSIAGRKLSDKGYDEKLRQAFEDN
ncbi:hypothetical protein BDV32DRAFT_159164 [Aspergillus pseudonomiae]|nr:hypothetical protein BDV32DRAFT_159164 [Aspergillus pseudonomiae]